MNIQLFISLKGEDPKYYSWVDGSWQDKNDSTSSNYTEADAALTEIGPGGTLERAVITTALSIIVVLSMGEAFALIDGISIFGLRNAITMYSYGVLDESLAYYEKLSAETSYEKSIVNSEKTTINSSPFKGKTTEEIDQIKIIGN